MGNLVEYGFNTTNFLSTNFNAPKARLNEGLQFFAAVEQKPAGIQALLALTSEQAEGTQFQGKISQPRAEGVQFQGEITADNAKGLQFLSQITKEVPEGYQFLGYISQPQAAGLQFQGKIEGYPQAQGLQFIAKRREPAGVQFRSIFYNVNKLRILCDYASRGTDAINWSTNSQETGDFDINNVNSDVVEEVYRSIAVTNVLMDCDTQVPQGNFIDTFAMLNHNLTTSANVSLIGSNVSDFSVIGVTIPISVTETNLYYLAPEIPNSGYRYWRILIDDNTNPDGYIEVGAVLFGSARIFQGECFRQPISYSRKHFSQTIETEGFTSVNNDRALRKELSLDFSKLDSTGPNYGLLSELFETYTTTHKCLWIPVPEYPGRYAIYGKLVDLPQEEHIDNGEDAAYASLSVTIDESR